MTQPTDLDQEEYLRQRPRSVAEDFGEDVILDLGPSPVRINASAKQHAARRTARDLELRRQRNLNQLQADARHQQDEAAHAEVMKLISRGESVSPALVEQAIRFSRTQGGLGIPSSQTLAGPTMARLARERQARIDETKRDRRR